MGDGETHARGSGVRPVPVSTVLLTLAAVVVALAGMRATAAILAPVLLALFLMICFRPLGAWLERHRVPKGVVILVNVLVIYGVLAVLGLWLYLSVARFASTVGQNASKLTDFWNWAVGILQFLGIQTNDIRALVDLVSPSRIASVAQSLLQASASVTTALAFIAALVFFMALDAASFSRRLRVSVRYRPAMATALTDFGHATRGYFWVAAVFGAAVAVVDWALLLVLDVPDAWLWALLAFVTNFIPNIGFLLGLVPPAIIAVLVHDWQAGLIVVVGYSVINTVVQTLIQPKVVGDRVQLNTTLTFLALIVWTFVLGGLGAILAIPMTLLVRALLIDSRPQLRWIRNLFSSGEPDPDEDEGPATAPKPAPPEPGVASAG